MVISSSTKTSETNYADLYRHYITKNITYSISALSKQITSIDLIAVLKDLDYALKMPEIWPYTVTLLLTLAPEMERGGHRSTWQLYLQQGIHQSQLLQDAQAEAELRLELGILYQQLGEYKPAKVEFKKSLALFDIRDQQSKKAKVLNRLAYLSRLNKDLVQATLLAKEALYLSEADEEKAYSYLVLGTTAFDDHQLEEAHRFFKKAQALWALAKNERLLAWTLTNLGATLQRLKKYKKAIKTYKKAILLLQKVKDPVNLAAAQMNLGNVYLSLEMPDKAIDFYQQSQRVFFLTQDKLRLAQVYQNSGMAYRRLKIWNKAKTAYRLSVQYWRELNNLSWSINSLDGLGLVYFEQGNFAKAITIFNQALNQLNQMIDHPDYHHRFEMVNNHLQIAQEYANIS